jgi:hypothetical protein
MRSKLSAILYQLEVSITFVKVISCPTRLPFTFLVGFIILIGTFNSKYNLKRRLLTVAFPVSSVGGKNLSLA